MKTTKYIISSREQLENIYDKPLQNSVRKETSIINEHYKKLIEASPFLAIASVGAEGMDCSPRGDGPGFIRILDEKTIAVPDRRGNNRLDTLQNILLDSRVALLLLIPGLNETIRINGNAHLSIDPELLANFEVNSKKPHCAIVVELQTMYFQCARAIKRSELWNVDVQVDPRTLPSAGTLIKSVISDFDNESYDSALQERQEKTLY
jgi:hypothetical protein